MSKSYEEQYLSGLNKIIDQGVWIKNERTGIECLTIDSLSFTYEEDDVALLSVKQCYPISSWAEMLGYYRRYEWASDFKSIGSNTWSKDANKTCWQDSPHCLGRDHMGKVYGAVTSEHEIPCLLEKIKNHEDDRGLILNFWRPERFEEGCLRPCLYLHNFNIIGDTLNLISSQRSCDYMVGKPFNAFSLWFKLKLFSHISGLKMGKVTHNIANPHIYLPHMKNAEVLASRTPLENKTKVTIPKWVNNFEDVYNSNRHARDYLKVEKYEHLGKLDFEMITS